MPKGMTNKKWQGVKWNIRGLDNVAKKQPDTDLRIKQNNPTGILYYRMNKFFMCECTGESLRNEKICDICKLTKRANNYMLKMIKDAAEGQGSII